jgi:uncharacterized protein YaeQ
VYSFNTKSDVWWDKYQSEFAKLNASFYRFEWDAIQALAALVRRTMDLSVTISDASAYIAGESGACEVAWQSLQVK